MRILSIQRLGWEEGEELLLQELIVHGQVFRCSTQRCGSWVCSIIIIRTCKTCRVSHAIQAPLNEDCPEQRTHLHGEFQKLDPSRLQWIKGSGETILPLSGELVLEAWVGYFPIQREGEGRYDANGYGNHR